MGERWIPFDVSDTYATAQLRLLIGVICAFIRPEEIAINYNTLTKQIRKDQVYTAGRFHLGIGHGVRSPPPRRAHTAAVRLIPRLAPPRVPV